MARYVAHEAVSAEKIADNPALADDLYGYLLVSDFSALGSYSNLSKALNLLHTQGWRAVSMSTDGNTNRLFVLMHRE